jgi:hypothetical protein
MDRDGFTNLPDTHKSRWGDELTAEKMKECVWLRPEIVAQIEFLECKRSYKVWRAPRGQGREKCIQGLRQGNLIGSLESRQ